MRELHLFAGIGGGILAGKMLGHRCVCAVEVDEFCQAVLMQRQKDGSLPAFPIYSDIHHFDGAKWRGKVDVVAGGFPCQDISSAGKGEGIHGSRSGLWFEMLRVVREVEPCYVFVENSPMLRTRGLGIVLRGLAELGFDAAWDTISAEDVGAPHLRKRMWILAANPERISLREQSGRLDGENGACAALPAVDGEAWPLAYSDSQRLENKALDPMREDGSDPTVAAGVRAPTLADADLVRCNEGDRDLSPRQPDSQGGGLCNTDGAGLAQREGERSDARQECTAALGAGWWDVEPDVGRVADGHSTTMDRLRLHAIGNAQVPLQAAAAFQYLLAAVRQS